MRRSRLCVGRIRKAHGTEGWTRVECFSADTAHLGGLRRVALAEAAPPVAVEGVRLVEGGLLVKLAGVDTREQAEALTGGELWVDREEASPIRDGEYYVGDLAGCVVRQGGLVLGTVAGFVEGGATELLEVLREDGGSFLVPFLDRYVGEVSVERGTVELREAFDLRGVRGKPDA